MTGNTNPGLDGQRYPERPIREPVSLDRIGLAMLAAFLFVTIALFVVALMLHAAAANAKEAEVRRSEQIARTVMDQGEELIELWRTNHSAPAAVIHPDIVPLEVDR